MVVVYVGPCGMRRTVTLRTPVIVNVMTAKEQQAGPLYGWGSREIDGSTHYLR